MARRKATTETVAETTKVEDKAVEVKVEAPVVEAAAETKAEEPKKTTRRTTAKKTAEKKPAAEKKTAEKKATTTRAAKKAEVKTDVHIQFSGKSYTEEDIMKIAKDVWKYDLKQKVGDLKSCVLYVKPEESMVYYVMNDEFNGSFMI